MLPRSNRLPAAIRLGKTARYSSPLFIMRSAKNDGDDTRFAVIVGKKVDKRAVVRNRIRRQFQSLFLQQLPQIKPGVDILCVVTPQCKEGDPLELSRAFTQALHRLEVLR